MHDFRLAIRALRATPVVSTVAALSLALGIGANTAIFSLVNTMLIRTLPVVEPRRLVTISSDSAIKLGFNAGLGWNYPMWDAFRQRSQTFDGALAWSWSVQQLDLAQGGERQPIGALVTSGEFFTTLGVRAERGRTLTAADDIRGGGPDGPVAVISHRLWQQRFGGAASIVGTTLLVERVPFRIVGVIPPEFFGLEVGRRFDVALPLATEPLIRGARASIDQRNNYSLFAMVKLKPGQSLEAATATLRAMQPEMHGSLHLPEFATEPMTLVSAAAGVDLPGSVRPRYERPLLTIFVVVALVLLIACANIANLLLARAAARHHELSVRVALGAPRWRLARQLLVESLVLAGLGAAAGLLLALWGGRAIVTALSSAAGEVSLDPSLDWRVLAFTAAVTVVTALLFGAGPALRSTRVAPIDALKEQGRGAVSSRSRGVSSGLVVAQVALSLMLIVAAGLFVRSFARLSGVPFGFDVSRVLLARVDTQRAHVDPAARAGFYARLIAAVAAAPGVAHAAASMSTPLNGGLPGGVDVSGAPSGSESKRVALTNAVTPEWFAVYGTALHAGRDIDARDTATAQPVVVINDALARQFLPGRSAIGEIVSRRTVIGVVADQLVHGGYKADGTQRSLRDDAPPVMYVPLAQAARLGPPDKTDVIINIRPIDGSPLPMRAVAAALTSVDPDLTFSLGPIADDVNAALAQERVVAALSGFFGALALLLAGLGLYGVTAHAVSRQRTEIGIRLALGAAPGGVVRLVLSRVSRLVALGIMAGAVASVWASTLVASLLYHVGARDPVTVAGAAVTLAIVGVLAGGIPAFRASRIDPVVVLRNN